MSYCKKCGAYIPDGQEICLACGFDEKGGSGKKGSSSAYAYEPDNGNQDEAARERAERRRREQQEMNRKWAEAEQARRRQQEEFARSREEAARRSAEQQEAWSNTNEDGYYRLHRVAPYGSESSKKSTAADSKVFSYLSYISFLCFLPDLLGIKDPKTVFHAKQGKKLFLAGLAGKIFGSIIGLGWIVLLGQIALTIIGLRNVTNDVTEELPVIGRWGEQK